MTAALGLCLLSNAQAQKLHLVTAALPPIAPSADHPGFMELVAREAFGRVGIEIEVSILPGERALINANNGLDDGDLLRIPGIEKAYPNLIRIPEKVMDFAFVAFTRKADTQIKGFVGLQPYTVAYVTGWKFYERNVKQAREITKVHNLIEMFGLLKKNRSEVVLAEHWQGLWAARQSGVEVYPVQPPFKVSDMYIYLNKRHAELVPRVARAIADMKADGSYQRIVEKTLTPLEVK